MIKNRPVESVVLACAVLTVCMGSMSVPASENANPKTRSQKAIEAVWGHMLQGSCDWRTPNTHFQREGAPDFYAMRFEWGPFQQHVLGELVGIRSTSEGERESRIWTLYMYHNPATDDVIAMQIARDGSLVTGRTRRQADGNAATDQIAFDSSGRMNMIRHVQILNEGAKTFLDEVYERDETGEWRLMREWTWTCRERAHADGEP